MCFLLVKTSAYACMICLTESLSSQQRFELWKMPDKHRGYIVGTPNIDTIHDTNLMYPIFSEFCVISPG